MLGLFVVALSLVVPFQFVELIVWCLLPTGLVAVVRYGDPEQRVFASGSLTTYVALLLQREHLLRMNFLIRWFAVATLLWLGGWLMTRLQQRLPGADDGPQPPPPPIPD